MDQKISKFYILLRCTKERFTVKDCSIRMKIHDLKGLLEFITGIPANIQRLCYLDEGQLVDNKEIQYYDLIENAVVNMDVYTIYVGLVKAIASGSFEDALKQGKTKSPSKSRRRNQQQKQQQHHQKSEDSEILQLNKNKTPRMGVDKKVDMYEIYYGMPYDEWAKTRDRFLSTHNMPSTKTEL